MNEIGKLIEETLNIDEIKSKCMIDYTESYNKRAQRTLCLAQIINYCILFPNTSYTLSSLRMIYIRPLYTTLRATRFSERAFGIPVSIGLGSTVRWSTLVESQYSSDQYSAFSVVDPTGN